MKKLLIIPFFLTTLLLLGAGCTDADMASYNLSKKADMFEVNRRIVFYNGITNEYMLSIEGFCSLGNDRTSTEISITCETGKNQYKKHFLGLSDNVTYFVEQVESENVSKYFYKVIFKPTSMIPDIDIK